MASQQTCFRIQTGPLTGDTPKKSRYFSQLCDLFDVTGHRYGNTSEDERRGKCQYHEIRRFWSIWRWRVAAVKISTCCCFCRWQCVVCSLKNVQIKSVPRGCPPMVRISICWFNGNERNVFIHVNADYIIVISKELPWKLESTYLSDEEYFIFTITLTDMQGINLRTSHPQYLPFST